MTRKKLKQYKALKKEIEGLEKAIDDLRDRAQDIPTVIGKVQASQPDFPYIEQHISVQMDEPKEADMISRKIRIKQKRLDEANELSLEIEQFVAGIQDSADRQIFEMVYLEGKKQREVAELVGYSRGRIPQKISQYLKD